MQRQRATTGAYRENTPRAGLVPDTCLRTSPEMVIIFSLFPTEFARLSAGDERAPPASTGRKNFLVRCRQPGRRQPHQKVPAPGGARFESKIPD